ncbi:MAG: DUF72 domain-containing protein [Acidobacteriota bacterium]|nr:DUF72 domain-containing protein [Acidobacteriota bacterium]
MKFTPVAATELAPAPRNLYAGTSGWAYPTWKPGFYPAEVPPRAFLHNYASRLTSVEVNYTFRTLPTPLQLKGWLDATPPGFRFSFKAPQRITHFQRLKASDATVREFIKFLKPARAANKLGQLLFQLPPNFKADPETLGAFLALRALADPSLQIAFEFRHPSWFAKPVYEILRGHNAALCIAESDDLATPDIATANFRCFRLRCSGGYTAVELETFAARFTRLARKQEVFVYFKHEDEPTGARNAETMLKAAAGLSAKARS